MGSTAIESSGVSPHVVNQFQQQQLPCTSSSTATRVPSTYGILSHSTTVRYSYPLQTPVQVFYVLEGQRLVHRYIYKTARVTHEDLWQATTMHVYEISKFLVFHNTLL